jgi:hypothetical protein
MFTKETANSALITVLRHWASKNKTRRVEKAMQEHVVNLTNQEFRLFQLIRSADEINQRKDDLLEMFIRQMELISEITSHKPKKEWLQRGDLSSFPKLRPVRPKKGSPLASDIILEQRKRLTERYE